MPPLRVELAALCTGFHKLLPAPQLLIGGSTDNRLLSQHAREIVGVARPVAGFDPAGSIENKTMKACGFDGGASPRKRLLASLLQVLGEDRHPRAIRFAVCDRLHDATDKDMEFARWTQLPSDPLELSLHLLRLRITKHVGEQRDCRAQAPKRDPHLVHALGVAAQRGWLIGDKLA